jgi:hypothetical protein
VGLSVLCGIQGIATVAIDFNRTHATNPAWTRHARFHVVWQTVTTALASVVELGLLWSGWVSTELGFTLALLLASLSPIAFLLSFAAERWFGGALSDPNGIPPLPVRLGSRVVKVDMNLVAVVAALVTIGALVLIWRG